MGPLRWVASVVVAAAIAAAAAALAATVVAPAPVVTTIIDVPSLWVVDDTLRVTANLTLRGRLNSSFRTPENASSSIAVDPVDGSLWGVVEGGPGVGAIVNYDRHGRVVASIPVGDFGGFGLEGITMTPAPDASLWVVDDPDAEGHSPTIYHLDRHGRRLGAFSVASFWPGAESPQDIAYDPHDGTLWLTDNAADSVIHITTDGELIGSFSTQQGPFLLDDMPEGIRNPQAVAVISERDLLVSSRYTGRVFRVHKTGTEVVEWMPPTMVSRNTHNIVGVDVAAATPVASTRARLAAIRDTLEASAMEAAGRRRADLVAAVALLDRVLVSSSSVWDGHGASTGEGVASIGAAVDEASQVLRGLATAANGVVDRARAALDDLAEDLEAQRTSSERVGA